ncbi:hypothetical protein [Micromonospora sp. CA-111912]|uniref:hypothetical protein n=1 Tax=Micromonospora sp. CA-111912 TaxID=3239955 RepID=UPI003D8C1E9D
MFGTARRLPSIPSFTGNDAFDTLLDGIAWSLLPPPASRSPASTLLRPGLRRLLPA